MREKSAGEGIGDAVGASCVLPMLHHTQQAEYAPGGVATPKERVRDSPAWGKGTVTTPRVSFAGASTPKNGQSARENSGISVPLWKPPRRKGAKKAVEAKKIAPETEVSEGELACVLGITGRRIRQMVEDGLMVRVGKGRYNLADCVQRYIAQSTRGTSTEEDAKMETARRKAEMTLKASKAEVARLEMKELQGKMHRSEDVAAMTEDLCFTIRSSLMALPGRLAVDVAAAQSPAEASEIIRKEVALVMAELANYRYDPKKYEERVRERRDWDNEDRRDDDDE